MGRGTESDNHPGWFKRTFWYFTCTQTSVFVEATKDGRVISESYPSLDLSTTGHVLMALLWVSAVLAYSVFVTYQHFTKPDKEMFTHAPTQGFDHPYVNVEAWCSNPPHCGELTITADFANAANSKCRSIPKVLHTIPANASGEGLAVKHKVPLCFTDNEIYTTNTKDDLPSQIGVLVDFKRINRGYFLNGTRNSVGPTQGVIRVTSYPDGENPMNKLMVLTAWQVRSLVMGQDIIEKYGTITQQTPYPLHVQYEGMRPSWRATGIITLAPYADFTQIMKEAGDMSLIGFVGLFGTCCGMAFMMNSLNTYLVAIFKKLFPGPAEKARKEEAAKKKDMEKRGESTADKELSETMLNGSADSEGVAL